MPEIELRFLDQVRAWESEAGRPRITSKFFSVPLALLSDRISRLIQNLLSLPPVFNARGSPGPPRRCSACVCVSDGASDRRRRERARSNFLQLLEEAKKSFPRPCSSSGPAITVDPTAVLRPDPRGPFLHLLQIERDAQSPILIKIRTRCLLRWGDHLMQRPYAWPFKVLTMPIFDKEQKRGVVWKLSWCV